MSLGLYWTYWRQLDSRMGRVRGCGLLYGAAMERERWRGWETAAFVFRSLERLGRNESGSSVQDSLMLCATNDTVYLFVPEDRSTPPTAFYGRPPGKCLFPSLFECVMLSNEKEPATLDLLVFNRYPIRKKKGWSIAWKTWFSKQISFLFLFSSQIIIIQLRDTLLLYIRRLLFRVIKRH